MIKESDIEDKFINKLQELKYTYRDDICDRATLEQNFRRKFEELNRVHLTDREFARLLDGIVSNDVFTAAETLREPHHFEREDGTPLIYTLVNIKDWCKNEFEVINQLRINTDNSHHRYDVIMLINGLPVVPMGATMLLVILACIKKEDNDADGKLHTRIISILNHSKYSLFEPKEMVQDNKNIFRKILEDLKKNYRFNPELFEKPS